MKQPPPPLTAERAIRIMEMVASEPEVIPTPQDTPQTASLADIRFEKGPSVSEHEVDRWIFENEVKPRLKAAGLPERFWKRITNWGCDAQRRVYEMTKAKCTRTGAIVVLTGNRGTGKTTIAGQIIIDRASDDRLPPWEQQPPYRKLQDLVARYKPLYADFGSVDTDQLMSARDAFCRHPLVIIDEIHESADMKMGERVLTDILDRRYAAKKDTILIGNQIVKDFKATVSDSVRSRISEHGIIIPCEWESWRAKQ